LEALGVSYRAIRLDRTGINPFSDVASFVGFLSLFRETKPDIVLNYTIKPVIYATLAARISGIRSVFSTITGLGYVFTGRSLRHRLLQKLVSSVYRTALSACKGIFFLNADDFALFKELNLLVTPGKAVLINGEGIDLERYNPYDFSTGRADPAQPVFLMIARVIRDKGILEYLEAARILKKKYAGAVFRLVGPFDSNPTAISAEEIQSWQQDGVIEYCGETADVRPFIAGSTVFVLPSYREGLPRTVIEAMAMGRPVVTTDAPGCRETVINGENGFLVQVMDAEALANAMERFIIDPDLIGKMGARSRELAEQKYDERKVNAMIIRTIGLGDEESF
jgi:glycosyltransferase involved in cell wall biosynthesis